MKSKEVTVQRIVDCVYSLIVIVIYFYLLKILLRFTPETLFLFVPVTFTIFVYQITKLFINNRWTLVLFFVIKLFSLVVHISCTLPVSTRKTSRLPSSHTHIMPLSVTLSTWISPSDVGLLRSENFCLTSTSSQ